MAVCKNLVTNASNFSVATFFIGSLVGSLFSSVITLELGHKKALLFSIPVALAAWIIVGLSTESSVAIISRFLHGYFTGIVASCVPNYLVEILHPSIRGRFTAMLSVFLISGNLSVTFIGSLGLHWRKICLIYGVLTVGVPLTGIFFLPQSPRWLILVGKSKEKALKSLKFYRGPEYDIEEEMTSILNQVEQNLVVGPQKNVDAFKALFTSPARKNFFLLIIFCSLFSATGSQQTILFSIPMFDSIGFPLNSQYGTVLCSTSRLLGVVSLLVISDKFGSKKLLHFSTYLCAISMMILSTHQFLKNQIPEIAPYYSWVAVASLFLFHASTSVSNASLMLLRCELLPTPVRAAGVSVFQGVKFLSLFGMNLLHPIMFKYLGPNFTYLNYAIICTILATVVKILAPNTKGKSLEELGQKTIKKTPKEEV